MLLIGHYLWCVLRPNTVFIQKFLTFIDLLSPVLFQDAVAPLTAREHNSKRKRLVDEGGDENKVTKRGEGENACPNDSTEKTTPVRKGRGQAKGGQKLFASRGEATKMKGNGKRLHVTYQTNKTYSFICSYMWWKMFVLMKCTEKWC